MVPQTVPDQPHVHQIASIVCEKEFRDRVSNIQPEQAALLADYLDNVGFLTPFPNFYLVYCLSRSNLPSIPQVLLSQNAYVGSDGCAVLGSYYRNLA
jgi:hypothetical protein